jgi:hypothetical protein
MNSTLSKFKDVIDEEIQAYESLGELYSVKQTLLVQGKSDALWDVDAKILKQAGNIRAINQKRKEVAKYLGDENYTVTDVIEKAQKENDKIANTLMTQRTKLRLLAKSLSLQEDTNMTLIKHGLTMVGKTLDMIVGAFMPQPNQYNNHGRNVESDTSLISSVVTEA